MAKLNLGSGDNFLETYDNLDAKFGDSLFPLRRKMYGSIIDYKDNEADEIRASHVLEHFPHHQTLDVLKEWVRVLKPGGWLKIAVPDFEEIARCALGISKMDVGLARKWPLYAMGGQTDENDFHKAIFTFGYLSDLLVRAGLVNIQLWVSEIQDCASLPVSLNLMGQKPEATKEQVIAVLDKQLRQWEKEQNELFWRDGTGAQAIDALADPSYVKPKPTSRIQVFAAGRWQDWDVPGGTVECATQEELDAAKRGELQTRTIVSEGVRAPKVALCLSTPRQGFLRPFERLLALAHQAGISVFSGDGVFWAHALSRSIRNAIEFDFEDGSDGFDFILTADYDTYAMIDDIRGLAELMARSPEADCLVPLQMKRGGTGEILAGGQNMNLTQPLVPIETGHFGLTLFRKSFFERMPKPWFYEKADAEGHWGDGRIDADIGFWLNAKKAKLNVMLAPQIVVGHGEELITYPRIESGKVVKVYQAVNDWLTTREKPEGIGVIQ